MGRTLPYLRRHGLDALIALGALEGAIEVAVRRGDLRAPETSAWFAAPAVAAVVLSLLLRRRFPFASPAAVWVLGAAISLVDGRLVSTTTSMYAAGIAAAFLLGNLGDGVQARIGLAMVLGAAATIVYNGPNRAAGDFVFVPTVFFIAWIGGYALRARAEQADAAERRAAEAERERESAARLAVAEERARIARELHDIVAHSLSVMVLQVGAVRHRLPVALTDDREALTNVERTGRAALGEMRRLLGALHDSDDVELAPQPGLHLLDALAEQIGRAGLPVHVAATGEPLALPPALDLSAYRIVQEALTNALKHARARRADVTVHYTGDAVQLEVRDDGVGATSTDGMGRGLHGMRERVKIYGGELTAGPVAGGGYVLTARLPVEVDR